MKPRKKQRIEAGTEPNDGKQKIRDKGLKKEKKDIVPDYVEESPENESLKNTIDEDDMEVDLEGTIAGDFANTDEMAFDDRDSSGDSEEDDFKDVKSKSTSLSLAI